MQFISSCKKDTATSPYSNNLQRKWIVTTVAGDGRALFADGPAVVASFRSPLDVAVAADGSIFVADALNHRIRKILSGRVTTVAGGDVADTTSGDASVARFIFPSELTVDSTGNLFTLDVDDPRVRKVSPSGEVAVYAGSGIRGFSDGPAATARFGEEALGITADASGNIFVSDYDNRRVREISGGRQVMTIAGNGSQGMVNGTGADAEFFSLGGIVVDKQGNLFVADWSSIRKISPSGMVSTFAGSGSLGYRDGAANQALFWNIGDMVIDEQGNIYVTDNDRVRMISPNGIVSTIAGSTAGYEDGDAISAKFNGAYGLAIDKQGNIFIADSHNNRIRELSLR